MKIHVLAGDALAGDFKNCAIEGEIVVCRECLVDGAVKAANLEEFWQTRAEFISDAHGADREEYFSGVASEFEKLKNLASAEAEINLWFEYELFCQVNLWFCLYLLRESGAKVFRVAPVVRREEEIWKGFGGLESIDLEKCFAERARFTAEDILLGADLWKAFQAADYQTLERLSETESKCFPYLKEVCRAEIEKNSRPKKILEGIIATGKTDFAEIFREFSARAGVYGFGDSQVRKILAEI
ncbi:MAG TPA: DUF1835 domain-containing protein [Pyrinomonadaceae bacterium]|nr:DUF1835 domain-containing protein [Pyrinomonadaceae bacterium]